MIKTSLDRVTLPALHPTQDTVSHLSKYVKRRPTTFGLICKRSSHSNNYCWSFSRNRTRCGGPITADPFFSCFLPTQQTVDVRNKFVCKKCYLSYGIAAHLRFLNHEIPAISFYSDSFERLSGVHSSRLSWNADPELAIMSRHIAATIQSEFTREELSKFTGKWHHAYPSWKGYIWAEVHDLYILFNQGKRILRKWVELMVFPDWFR